MKRCLLPYVTLVKYQCTLSTLFTWEDDQSHDKNEKRERSDLLYQAILTLQSLEECKNFFSDLCTVAELRAMEQRFEVATLLSGGMIYNDILERTGASSATISRVNRSLQYGANGYQAVLPRLKGSLPGEGDQPGDEAGTPLGEADGL